MLSGVATMGVPLDTLLLEPPMAGDVAVLQHSEQQFTQLGGDVLGPHQLGGPDAFDAACDKGLQGFCGMQAQLHTSAFVMEQPLAMPMQKHVVQQGLGCEHGHYGVSISGSEDETTHQLLPHGPFGGTCWVPTTMQPTTGHETGFVGDFGNLMMQEAAFTVDPQGSFDDILSGSCFQSASGPAPYGGALSGTVEEGTLLFDLEEPFPEGEATLLQHALPKSVAGTEVVAEEDVLLPSSPSSRGDSCPLPAHEAPAWGPLAPSGPSERSLISIQGNNTPPMQHSLQEQHLPGSPRSASTSVLMPTRSPMQQQQLPLGHYPGSLHGHLEKPLQEDAVLGLTGYGRAPKPAARAVGGSHRGHHGSGVSKFGGPCMHCGATESPQWRRGPEEKPMLCNACGTRYRRSNQLGPVPGPPPPRGVNKKKAGQAKWSGGKGRGRKS